ncbi:DUF1573 domain-containing protein [Candidatus Parcubacteria bacterium]|nr:MAG: DUF1573 domain-containing protein [Candidatus Parcubacteria bacterium]
MFTLPTETDSNKEVAGELTFSELKWDLGTVSMANENVEKEITITNDSGSDITINHMETSCMCTTAQLVHDNGDTSGIKGMVCHGTSPAMSETIANG